MPQRRLKPKHPKIIAQNTVVTGINQLWEADLKYGWIQGENRFFFLLTFLDVFDRRAVGYHLGLTCKGIEAANTLRVCVQKERIIDPGCKPKIRTDNGTQVVCIKFEGACIELNLEHERIPVRTPNLNAHIESYHSILEAECFGRHEFISFAHAYRVVSQFIDFYNNVRIHSGINYMSPNEYSEAIKSNSIKGKAVHV